MKFYFWFVSFKRPRRGVWVVQIHFLHSFIVVWVREPRRVWIERDLSPPATKFHVKNREDKATELAHWLKSNLVFVQVRRKFNALQRLHSTRSNRTVSNLALISISLSWGSFKSQFWRDWLVANRQMSIERVEKLWMKRLPILRFLCARATRKESSPTPDH